MKQILLINGSPKGRASNTLKLTEAFLRGLNRNKEYSIEEIICSQADVQECRGCFHCWRNEAGHCSISDGMGEIFQKYLAADLVIWSFPNYFYGMPSGAKRILDRLLPLYYQNLYTEDNVTTHHLRRHELKDQKYLLFCSCGLYNTEQNVDGIRRQFELLYGDRCEMLFCSESQLLSNAYMHYCVEAHLAALEEAGWYYRQSGALSEEIQALFQQPFLPIGDFLSFVDASAVLRGQHMSEEAFRREKLRAFFRKMALTYVPSTLHADHSVLEIELTDSPYRCQLHLDRERCIAVEDPQAFLPYRLKVITDLSFFVSNAALTKGGKPREKGPDFNTLIALLNKFEKMGITKELRFS